MKGSQCKSPIVLVKVGVKADVVVDVDVDVGEVFVWRAREQAEGKDIAIAKTARLLSAASLEWLPFEAGAGATRAHAARAVTVTVNMSTCRPSKTTASMTMAMKNEPQRMRNHLITSVLT